MANNSNIEMCARMILDTVPEAMQRVRSEMRANRAEYLSVPQFRAMLFLGKNAGASQSTVADFLGLSPAGTSAVIEGLVGHGLVVRSEVPGDRRKVALALTAKGRKDLERTRAAALEGICALIAGLGPEQRRTVAEALELLHGALSR